MNKKKVFLIIGYIILFTAIFVLLFTAFKLTGSVTRITNNQITAQNFNMSGGRFRQEANVLSEVGFIQDDSVGGEAQYISALRGLYVSGKYAYTTSDGNDDALCIFDVYNPSNITEISCIRDDAVGGDALYLGGPSAVVVSGKYAYVTAKDDNALSVFDISDPTNITEVGYIKDDSVGGEAYALSTANQPTGISLSGRYIHILSKNDASLSLYDISDPTNITEVGYIKDISLGGTAHFLKKPRQEFIQGDYSYVVSFTNSSLSIFDISDPTNITEVGYILDDSNGGTATMLEGAKGIYVSGNYAYIMARNENALTVFDISNKSTPKQISYIQDDSNGGTATHLESQNLITGAGNYLYVASSLDEDTLCVFDISNPYHLQEIQCVVDSSQEGSFLGLNNPKSFFLAGKYLYLTSENDHSFSIIEISGIESPSLETGTIETSLINILGNAHILRDLYIGNGLNVAGSGLFSSGLGVFGTLELIGNLTINGNQGITGNYTNGNCWTAYSGGIIYETNCTSS